MQTLKTTIDYFLVQDGIVSWEHQKDVKRYFDLKYGSYDIFVDDCAQKFRQLMNKDEWSDPEAESCVSGDIVVEMYKHEIEPQRTETMKNDINLYFDNLKEIFLMIESFKMVPAPAPAIVVDILAEIITNTRNYTGQNMRDREFFFKFETSQYFPLMARFMVTKASEIISGHAKGFLNTQLDMSVLNAHAREISIRMMDSEYPKLPYKLSSNAKKKFRKEIADQLAELCGYFYGVKIQRVEKGGRINWKKWIKRVFCSEK